MIANDKISSSEKLAQEVLRLRLSQLLLNEFIKKREFKIPIHLALGHEALAAAVSAVMEEKDQLVLSHRNIHYNLARESSLRPELEEYYLKPGGLGQGQLGSMNLANPKKGMPYTSSILGNNLAVAAGLALAKKVQGEKSVVFVVAGDGAIEEGSFYESLLFMKSQNLSSLIIVENNGWSLATSIEQRRCQLDLSTFCQSLGIRYESLKSNDVFEYQTKLQELKEFSLQNKMPVCVEAELTTFGFWWIRDEKSPQGRFVNYHAGAAPELSLLNLPLFPLLESSERDPLFSLTRHFPSEQLSQWSEKIRQRLEEEAG